MAFSSFLMVSPVAFTATAGSKFEYWQQYFNRKIIACKIPLPYFLFCFFLIYKDGNFVSSMPHGSSCRPPAGGYYNSTITSMTFFSPNLFKFNYF